MSVDALRIERDELRCGVWVPTMDEVASAHRIHLALIEWESGQRSAADTGAAAEAELAQAGTRTQGRFARIARGIADQMRMQQPDVRLLRAASGVLTDIGIDWEQTVMQPLPGVWRITVETSWPDAVMSALRKAGHSPEMEVPTRVVALCTESEIPAAHTALAGLPYRAMAVLSADHGPVVRRR